MNAERLLAHFDRLAEAPDAVPRLRRFILDLAVRGKLVGQDPKDEPASTMLDRVQADRDRVASSRKREPSLPVTGAELPFEAPAGWQWARFAEIARIQSNLVDPTDHPKLPHIAPDNIESWTGRLLPYETVADAKVFSSKHFFTGGCILYSKIRPALAKAVVVDFAGLCSADMYPIRPLIDRGYLHRFMLSELFVDQAVSEDNRVAMPKINQAALSKILVAVPPLAEQRRIVAKVDELMALSDRLDAAQAERESRRDRLVGASLHSLGGAAEQDGDIRDIAQFSVQHLPRLTTKPEYISAFRQAILDLAVRGLVCRQNPNEESAGDLLDRLQCERRRLADSGEIKRWPQVPPVEPDDQPFAAPNGWGWVRLGELLLGESQNGYSRKPDDAADGLPILRISAGTSRSDGVVAEEDHKRVSGVSEQQQRQYSLEPGDLLACRFNGNRRFVGRLALYCGYSGLDPIYPDKLIRLRMFRQFVEPKLIRYFFDSTTIRQDVEAYSATTVGNWGISASNLKEVKVPLPPLGEQQRIVAKLDELMSVCDRLEAQLAAARTESSRLLEAVLHEALAPAA